MRRSGDPVPSVGEAEAKGEIADLYGDIRETLGMSFVNLLWRNIASIPTAFQPNAMGRTAVVSLLLRNDARVTPIETDGEPNGRP